MQLFVGLFHAVLDLGVAIDLIHDPHHVFAHCKELLLVGTCDRDGKPATEHRTHGIR